MLVDLFADDGFTWDEPRERLLDGAKMRQYQLRAAHKIYTGEPIIDPKTGEKAAFLGFDEEDEYRDGTAVHIDPGLGKTIIGLTAIVEWKKRGWLEKRPVLIVAPIKVCETVWRQEAKLWRHTQGLTFRLIRGNERERAFEQKRPADVHLINPELLLWLQKYIRADWEKEYFALIIDESSMFKDHRSKRFRVLSNYGTRVQIKNPDGTVWRCPLTGESRPVPQPRFKRSAMLTGTPSTSGLQNLWAPFKLLDHGARLHAQFDTFQGRFFHKTRDVAPHVGKYELNPEEDEVRPEYMVRDGGKERIHELISDITVELDASDYGVLPPQLPPVLHYIDLPDEILPHYRQLERDAVLEMLKDPVIAANGGAKSMMCWQICNGAIYSVDAMGKREVHNVHDRKLDKLVELIDLNPQNRLVPYWFNHDRDRITERLRNEGIPFSVLGAKNTQRVLDEWNEGAIQNLLIHPQSAAHGLNMQFGGHWLTWFGPIWSLERWLQTIARLARSGQKGIVGVDVIMARNTTDEVRWKSLNEHGDEQTRFRKAMREYQQQMGIDIGSLPEFEDTFKGLVL